MGTRNKPFSGLVSSLRKIPFGQTALSFRRRIPLAGVFPIRKRRYFLSSLRKNPRSGLRSQLGSEFQFTLKVGISSRLFAFPCLIFFAQKEVRNMHILDAFVIASREFIRPQNILGIVIADPEETIILPSLRFL